MAKIENERKRKKIKNGENGELSKKQRQRESSVKNVAAKMKAANNNSNEKAREEARK